MFLKTRPSVESAFRVCEKIAFRHYENFPVASIFLPRNERRYIAAIYAFARTADDFADEDGTTDQERLEKLSEWQWKLRTCFEGLGREPLFIALGETIQRFHLPLEYFERLLTAFRMDVEKKRYETWEELLHYCSHSANPIGRLILQLFGYDGEERFHASDAICTALQLTNFWQDLSIDVGRNRIYLPIEDLRKFHCLEEDILAGRTHDKFLRLMSHEVARTMALFDEGSRLLRMVGKDLHFQLRVTMLGGRKILEKIERKNYNILRERPAISLWDKVRLIMLAKRSRKLPGTS